MTYARDGGQVIEFDGKRSRKNYDQSARKPVEEHEAPPSIILAGRVLKPLTAYIRRRFKIKSINLSAMFGEDGSYTFMATMADTEAQIKAAMFSELPGRKFSVWRGR